MENNKVATLNSKYEVLNIESYPSAEAAYADYVETIRILRNRLPKGEKVTVVRYRWNQIMAMETVSGNC